MSRYYRVSFLFLICAGCAGVRDSVSSLTGRLTSKPPLDATVFSPKSPALLSEQRRQEDQEKKANLSSQGTADPESAASLDRAAGPKPESAGSRQVSVPEEPSANDADRVVSLRAVEGGVDSPVETAHFGDQPDSEPQDPASVRQEDLQKVAAEEPSVSVLTYDEVVGSVYRSYPLLQSALYGRNIALGQQVGASGAFDTKLKGASENGPQGFYQTYRQSIGVVQPTYWGGEVFAGYRVGRGEFQPWYLERQTNDGGEFKAGVLVPLARNREIDARRAELWKSGLGRSLAEPDIQAQLIGFVQEASYGYWDWVAAGEYHEIAERVLALAEDRTSRIEAQVEKGFVDPPELTDNLRLVAIRRAKTADTRRKLEQTAAKLSVYFRNDRGEPLLPSDSMLPGFPDPDEISDDVDSDIRAALTSRPELRVLSIIQQQLRIDYSEAVNQLQPEVNAVLSGSQDVGEPTSAKRDKSPYEGEASVFLDVPVQRRKARGKMTELQGKIAQVSAKRQITADKIMVDVRMAHAALRSAYLQVQQSLEALRHAEDLAARERQNQEAGVSDLLKVALREQYAVESAEKNVDALRLFFESRADYRAAMGLDQIDR
ncbi:MAG: TolC family protein [Planctomyces sp.]